MRGLLLASLLVASPATPAAGPELGLAFARSTKARETDIVRLTYRHPLPTRGEWWMPAQLQLGASAWRVPDIGGTTQRLDLNVTPVWRVDKASTYIEGGIGVYLLSKTINNDVNHLPSSFQFGSHLGAGLRLDAHGRLGLALQHISNGGLKQPNGGINLVLVTASVEL